MPAKKTGKPTRRQEVSRLDIQSRAAAKARDTSTTMGSFRNLDRESTAKRDSADRMAKPSDKRNRLKD